MNERINDIAKNLKGNIEVDGTMALMSEYRTYSYNDSERGYMLGRSFELSAKALYLDTEEDSIDPCSCYAEDVRDFKIIRKLRKIYAKLMTGILTRPNPIGVKLDKAMTELYRIEDEMAKPDFKYTDDLFENMDKLADDVCFLKTPLNFG